MPHRRREEGKARRRPRTGRRTTPPTAAWSRSPSICRNATLSGRPGIAVERRGRQHRREADRRDRDEHERQRVLHVREPPPALPARQVRRRRLELEARSADRRRLLHAGDRAHEARHVLAPCRSPCRGSSCSGRDSGRRRRPRTRSRRAAARSPGARGHVADARQARAAAPATRPRSIAKATASDARAHDRRHLHEDQPLERDVDDRRERQRGADHDQRPDRDRAGVAAEHVGRKRRRTHRPAGPEVREIDHHREHQPPVPPEAVESGQRGLAGRQRVALDLHVQEELRHDADDRAPEEARVRPARRCRARG